MKKLTALFLTLMLLCAAAIPALAEEGKAESKSTAWPVIEMNGIPAQLISEGFGEKFRYQTFSGPGRGYSLSGAYLPRKVNVMAIGRENEYAMIDVEYSVGRRLVYLEAKYVIGGGIPEISAAPVTARIKATASQMYYGPGNQYDVVRQRTKSKYADMSMAELMKIFDGDKKKIAQAVKDVFPAVKMPVGARVSVLYEVNGWVCIESDCTELGRARTWVPADQVEAE